MAKALGSRWLLSLWLVLGLAAGQAAADAGRQQAEAEFAAWREALWTEARDAGISRATFDGALGGVTLDWSLPDLEPPGGPRRQSKTGQQAEFGSPGRYFSENNISILVSRGRAERDRRLADLQAIERRYGVPHQILLAIWGRETAYGTVNIPHDAIRSLATQAFMGRRTAFFRTQLIAALKLLEGGHGSRADLRSSWAGAMGHTQMLPTHILQYGVDFDGDGRRNVWGSVSDALAATARFLAENGWQTGLPWGYEVTPPPGADCALEGPHQGRPFGEWMALGYERTRGRSLPPGRDKTTGYLLMPAGRYGPAFLVTENFYVLKAYNESDLYALYVGHVADRLDNDRPFEGRWGNVSTYGRDDVKALQTVLVANGYNVGDTIDGLVGFRTRIAAGDYQRKHGLTVDCWPGPETLGQARREG
ncbi:MAG: lytic murein transglycosylase [Hyphomicrobiales bacterium]